MSEWLRWTAPAAALVSLTAPAYAVQYMSVAEAQKAAFPSATLTEVQPGRVWKTSGGGIFVLDHVIGKHLYIDYAVSIEGGRVRRVDILAYRESYGGDQVRLHDNRYRAYEAAYSPCLHSYGLIRSANGDNPTRLAHRT